MIVPKKAPPAILYYSARIDEEFHKQHKRCGVVLVWEARLECVLSVVIAARRCRVVFRGVWRQDKGANGVRSKSYHPDNVPVPTDTLRQLYTRLDSSDSREQHTEAVERERFY